MKNDIYINIEMWVKKKGKKVPFNKVTNLSTKCL